MVTILWTLDRNGFVTKLQHVEGQDQIISTVLKAAAAIGSELFVAMAKVNPEARASAAQLLDKHFKGKGLTTRPESITPLKD